MTRRPTMAPDQNPADGNTNTWRISFSLDSANVFESFFPRSKIIPFNENDINVNDHVIVPAGVRDEVEDRPLLCISTL